MRAYAQALGTASRDLELGAARFRLFLEAYPESSFADDAALRLAELDRQRGVPMDTIPVLRRVIADNPTGNRTDAARLVLTRLEYQRGQPEAAWRAASELRLSLLSDEERREAHRLLADLAARRDDRAEQIHWLTRVRADAASRQEEHRIEAEIEAVVGEMEPADLAEAAQRLGRRVPAARLWLLAAERSLTLGEPRRAKAALVEASLLPLTPRDEVRLATLEAALGIEPQPETAFVLPPPFTEAAAEPLPSLERAAGTLGVVLPLTGRRPLDAVAEESLQGILMAAGIFGRDSLPGPGPVELRVRDSQGRPEQAAAAVLELARDEGVTSVIGPLTARESEAAAQAADQAGIPLLTLTHDSGVAHRRSSVFRFGLTRRVEAEALADYAVRELGLTRFAIMYPRDTYGRELETLFWRALEARGANVVGVASYDPSATDFADPIRRLIGYVLLTPEERAALEERKRMLQRAKRLPPEKAAELREEARAMLGPNDEPLPPIVDFEALFIPDSHDNVKLIAPQLAYHAVDGVRLLGSSGWNHPDLVRIAGQHVEGAVFTADFDTRSAHPTLAEFAERYRATFGQEPDVFAAQAYDATNLALLQLARGANGPVGLRDGLLSTRAYPGVSGVTSLLPDGNARKRPFLLGVERRRIVSLEDREAPALPRASVAPEEAEPGPQ
jgi:ABC-type branched-subunit amino acid transport system substrate-binding protein